MNLKNYFCVSSFAAIAIGGGMLGAGVSTALASEDMEVLTRGPVHEAFAETVAYDPVPGIIVTAQPPALIEEVMPDQRPSGDNVAWIPGYWGWDEERNDFLWISGIWRNLPPGREWVPGYWSTVSTGHQWTSGYWQDAETSEVTYLPEPPRSVERGPNIKAASNDQTWIPGNWQYQEDRYAWRAGYWVTARPNWCWTPSYYRWAPRGYVYVDGYWDYPVVSRGVIFAPVHFQRAYCERPDFYYAPETVISLSVFSNHLFLRPNYCHYYFGDYYEPRYRDNYYASCDYGSRYRGYDPIYAYDRYENRNDQNWDRQQQDDYAYRRDHAEARPPRTWDEMNARPERDRGRGDFAVAERYDRVVDSHKDGRSRYQTVSSDERQRFVSQKNEIRNYSRERQQRESISGREPNNGEVRAQTSREKAIRSPLASRQSDRSDKTGGPPERLEKRTSSRGDLVGNDRRNEKATQGGRAAQESAKTNARQGDPRDPRDGPATAKNKAEPNRESRTQPGQRRDDSASAKGKSKQQGETNGRSNAMAGGKTEMSRKETPSSTTQGKGEANRSSNPGEKTVDKARPGNERQSSEKRSETAGGQRREQPAPQRQANPQPERRAAQPSDKQSRQETPSRKGSPGPTRDSIERSAPQRQQAAPERVQPKPQQFQPQRQPQRQQSAPERVQPKPQQFEPKRQQSAPERVQPKPQQFEPKRQQSAPERVQPKPQQFQPQRQQAAPERVQPKPQQFQPQRQQAPRPEPRQAQPAPQRQQMAPQREQPRPQQAAPQRQQAPRPEPQRQSARPAPQPEARSSSKKDTTDDRQSESKKTR